MCSVSQFNGRFAGRTAVVTGGASGLGLQVARRIVAEGDVHHIRDLIDEHPHTVHVRAAEPRVLAREFLTRDDVLSLKLEQDAIVVETSKPDGFYRYLTELAASGLAGSIAEVTSPDDNLQAVFKYLVK